MKPTKNKVGYVELDLTLDEIKNLDRKKTAEIVNELRRGLIDDRDRGAGGSAKPTHPAHSGLRIKGVNRRDR